ncbi:MAG: outer membrane protein assembly factor BamA, partial [Polyangiales bacterium]
PSPCPITMPVRLPEPRLRHAVVRTTGVERRRYERRGWLTVLAAFVIALGFPARAIADGPSITLGPAASTSAVPSASGAPSTSAVPAASTSASASASVAAPAPAPPPRSTVIVPKTLAEESEGLKIRKIEVERNTRVATERILDYMRLKVGDPFSPSLLSRDVRELYTTGMFDDVEVELFKNDDGTIDLRLRVRERANVKLVIFEGNKALEADKIREEIEIKENNVLSVPAVRRSVQKLKDKYAEKGYFLAQITAEVVPLRENEANVKFTIVEGAEVSIKRITFVGNHHIPDDDLKAIMLSAQGGFLGLGSGASYRKDVFERDVLMIQALYSDRGFLTVSVGTPRVMLTPDREGIEVTIVVDEGPQYKVKALDVYEVDPDGKEVEPVGGKKKLHSLLTLKAGDDFNRALLVRDLTAVKTLYHDGGYANVDAEPQTQLDGEKREVTIRVPIKRGVGVHFGRIEVRGNAKTSDQVIRREMTIIEGQPYSETGLETSRRRIMALGYFERVDITPERSGATDALDIFVEVAERPTGTFQIGAGFSSIESFILTAQIQQANLFGRGQSLSLQAQASGLRTLINLRFFEPYVFGSSWSGAMDVYDQQRIYDTFSQTSLGSAITLGYPIIAPWLRASLTYTAERVRVTNSTGGTLLGTSAAVSFFQRLPLANLFQDGITSSVKGTILWDTRDNRLFATNGLFIQASSEFATPELLSENTFIRHRVSIKGYYPLGEGVVFKVNTEWGDVTSPSNTGVPIFARFFLGGIYDVRGFKLRSIGPRLPLNASVDPNSGLFANGANIGGNMELYTNVEIEFPILDKVGIRGVVFFDAGNAFNTESLYCQAAHGSPVDQVVDPCNQNIFALRTSTGVGIRWFSPLGPLRFEWGFPLARLPYEDSSVFEFTIGNFF